MTSGVYAIVNLIDGMAYVGSSTNIELRWSTHRSVLNGAIPGAPRRLYEAWAADGPECFDWLILERTEPTDEALEEAEQRWMDSFDGGLYNTRLGARRPRPGTVTLMQRGHFGPEAAAQAKASAHFWALYADRRRRRGSGGSEHG